MTNRDKYALRLAYLIAGIWAASTALEAAWTAYQAPLGIHALMMAAAGWAFGAGMLGARKQRNGNGNGE